MKEVPLAQVAAQGTVRTGAAQDERLERAHAPVHERGLHLEQQSLEAAEVLLVVEVGADEQPGVV